MKPWLHAKASVKKYGGIEENYIELHDFFDQTKSHFPDMRHRAILHSSFGIYLLEQMFGTIIINSQGKEVSVRDIGEDHVIQDMGRIPTIQDYLNDMPFYPWLGGIRPKTIRKFKFMKDSLEEEAIEDISDDDIVDVADQLVD